jgi:hypothetical protein
VHPLGSPSAQHKVVAPLCCANAGAKTFRPTATAPARPCSRPCSRREFALADASEKLRADHVIVSTAVQQDGDALKYASEELHAERKVVLAAWPEYGGALQYASKELRADHEIVLAAAELRDTH